MEGPDVAPEDLFANIAILEVLVGRFVAVSSVVVAVWGPVVASASCPSMRMMTHLVFKHFERIFTLWPTTASL